MTKTQAATEQRMTQFPGSGAVQLPAVSTAVKDAKATREQLFTLRHFHLGDPATKRRLDTVTDDCLPALLDPFRDTSRLRFDYPLFLFPPAAGDGRQQAKALVCRLAQWLEEEVTGFAPGKDDARILKDHLPWLEQHLRQALKEHEGPVPAQTALATAGAALQTHLDLDQSYRVTLDADLTRLQAAAGKGELLGYARFPALHLLVHAIRSRVLPRRARFQAEIEACVSGLKALLEVEWSKSDESIEPRLARDSVGPAGALFDPLALSNVMEHSRGTHLMSAERRARIEQALAVLQAWQVEPVLVRFVHLGNVTGDWLAENHDLCEESASDPCTRATSLFDQAAEQLAEVLGAARIARLEIEGKYDPVIHDPWFVNFDWQGFSHEELLLVPVVIALENADRVAGLNMRSFSRLLSSGRPIQVLIRVQASNNPGARPDENPFRDFRTELGYLGLAHRQAAVTQSSAARFEHLTECFLASLDVTHTSLHLINTGTRSPGRLVPLNAWLVAGAAIEGRAHPFFRAYPEADEVAPVTMDFAGNPAHELDWPIHPFRYLDENGNRVTRELAFTFADYCLLIERLRDHYRVVPPGCDSDALVPMQDYLEMDRDQAYHRVPFVWAVNNHAILHRLVVSWELAMACLDRLNYWRTLQEMAGVRNRYVDRAIEYTRNEERLRAAAERDRLLAAHAQEVERVRAKAAGEAMQRLTDMLLGLDLDSGAASGAAATPTHAAGAQSTNSTATQPQPDTQKSEEVPATNTEEEDEELSFDDPWIDTPLCTSCNDCMKINSLLFIYNEEKQAVLGDLGNATYAQMVEAAELCPAKCIHPGQPWNQEEPGLATLIERAAPFNQ